MVTGCGAYNKVNGNVVHTIVDIRAPVRYLNNRQFNPAPRDAGQC